MKIIINVILSLMILLFISGCSKISYNEQLEQEIDIEIQNMTLKEKIGQMFIVYHEKSSFTEDYLAELQDSQVGGFIIFDKNITSFAKTKQLINSIVKTSRIPMFITVDQEGGKVQRLLSVNDKKATFIPEMKRIGEKNDLNLSYALGTVIGEECRSLGINTIFGPVMDVGDNKTSSLKNRLISNDARIVSDNGVKIAEGINDSGVIPVYKHFPGLASSKIDSHIKLPVINKTLDELQEKELIPFISAIENSYYRAEMIMIGHANYPKITNDKLPASLSKKIVNDLLRQQLNFNGVVVTDALNMNAISDNYNEEEIFELGINASIDIFLMPNNVNQSINIIENLIKDGRVEEAKINSSVKRILKLKRKYLYNFNSLDELYFGSSIHHDIIDKFNY